MAKQNSSNEGLDFENTLWETANQLRGHMDAAEYKHVVLGLIFLKYITDSFNEYYRKLETWTADPDHEYFVKEPSVRYEVLEDRDEYTAENVFWVPKNARWSHLQANAKRPEIGQIIDEAMELIERENPNLKGVLPKDYARPTLNKQRLGELIDLIGNIGLGDEASRRKDVLGRVYEYFLGRFAAAEGKKGGEFYTARSVVKLLVATLEPYKGRVYDPCCGSGGMFTQSEEFVEAHGGKPFDIAIYGQESNPTTWRLSKMNLALHGIEGDLGPNNADTFFDDLHKDMRVDYILANPPFNMKAWGGEQLQKDVRWKFGVPPKNNANFAWVQHIIHHLSPSGRAGFLLANGSMSSMTGGEGDIRKAIVEADLVDCMVALPGQLFYTTQIPVCLWFLARNKGNGWGRDRRGEVLFIDARELGTMISRTQREMSDEDIDRITATFRFWAKKPKTQDYEDVPGFAKSASIDDIRQHNFVLTPGRYVGIGASDEDDELFEDKMERLTMQLGKQIAASTSSTEMIVTNLRDFGYEP